MVAIGALSSARRCSVPLPQGVAAARMSANVRAEAEALKRRVLGVMRLKLMQTGRFLHDKELRFLRIVAKAQAAAEDGDAAAISAATLDIDFLSFELCND